MSYRIISLSTEKFNVILKREEIYYSFVKTVAGILKASHCSLGVFRLEFVDYHEGILEEISSVKVFLMVGTPFQQQVWNHALRIPRGFTKTYQQLANEIGNPKGCRAVARALAANALAYIIPCHRVIGSNGNLTGYRWGIERKHRLLDAEKIIV